MEDGKIVDIGVRRRRTMASRKAEQDIAALQSGGPLRNPIILLCHIRGEADPFPRRWRYGSLTLGQGDPVWRPMRLRRRGEPLAIPPGTKVGGVARPLQREELSAFCPNPRKSAVVPLDSPAGRIFVGLQKDSAATLLTAMSAQHEGGRSAGASVAE